MSALRILFIALAVVATPACSRSGPDEEATSPRLRVALSADIRTTQPGVLRDANTDDVLMHVVEPLLTYREDLSLAPLLADRWHISDDGRRYELHLREDVSFHNGEPLSAEIVAWNIRRYLDPGTGWICRVLFDGSRGLEIKGVTVLDRLRLLIELNRPDRTFLHKLANLQCNMGIVHPDSLHADGTWRGPVGTGPFVFEHWESGRFVDLRRHAAYRPAEAGRDGLSGDRRAAVERLRWVIVPEPAAAKAGLVSGQLDVIYRLQLSDVFDLQSAAGVHVAKRLSLDWDALLMQSAGGALADVWLRRAIAHAVDRATLADVTTGVAEAANSAVIPRESRYYDACMNAAPAYSMQLARAALARSDYEGEALQLIANRRFPAMYENAIVIQHMLSEVGIRTTLEVMEWTTQLDHYARGDFELMSFGFTGRTHPVLNYEAILGSKDTNPMYQWDDVESLALLNDVTQSADDGQAAALLCQLHAAMIEVVPVLNLFNHPTIDAWSDRVKGYEPSAFNKPRLWGVSLADARAAGAGTR